MQGVNRVNSTVYIRVYTLTFSNFGYLAPFVNRKLYFL